MEIPKHLTLIERVRWLHRQEVLTLRPDHPLDGRFYRDGYPKWMDEMIEEYQRGRASRKERVDGR